MTKKATKGSTSVAEFLATLEHPLKGEIISLRKLILGLDSSISEEIKWNAPSFRTSEHFATMHLRAKDSLQLILHLGAKAGRAVPKGAISDPEGLLKWLGPDRASLTLRGKDDLATKRRAISAILRQWITHV